MNNNVVEFLKEQLERTNYWLSFAEAKNAALIAMNIAMATVMIGLIDKYPILSAITLIIFMCSSLFCIYSFKANGSKAQDNKKTSSCMSEEAVNLLFWKDISKLESADKYLELVIKNYFNNDENELLKLKKDYADEIYVNSIIADKKYSLFNKALFFDIISVIICILVFIVVA